MLSLVFVKTILKPTNYLRKFWVGFFYSLPDVALILKHLTLFCLQKVLLSYLLLQTSRFSGLGSTSSTPCPVAMFRMFVPLCGFCAHSDLNRRSPIVLEFRCVHLGGFSTMWGSRSESQYMKLIFNPSYFPLIFLVDNVQTLIQESAVSVHNFGCVSSAACVCPRRWFCGTLVSLMHHVSFTCYSHLCMVVHLWTCRHVTGCTCYSRFLRIMLMRCS